MVPLPGMCKLSCAICQSFEHLVEECPILLAAREMFGMPCGICLSYEHLVEECPTNPAMREMFGDCNTYNSNWRDHSKFSWKLQPPQYQQLAQAPQQASNLEQVMMNLNKVMEDFVEAQKSINAQLSQRISLPDRVESSLNKKMDGVQHDLSQKIDNLQDSISRFANLNTVQEKENYPSQPYQNSKGIHEVGAQEGESSMVKEVETVITLRSGKEVDLPTCKLEHKVESEARERKERKSKEKRKGKSTEKDDYIDEEPQKIVIKEEIMKKQMHPLSSKLYMAKSYKASLNLGSQESIASNAARFGVETKKLWLFEDDCAKLNEILQPHPISLLKSGSPVFKRCAFGFETKKLWSFERIHFAFGRLLHPYPPQSQALLPHFVAFLMPKTRGAMPLPQSTQIPYEESICDACGPSQIPPRSPPTKEGQDFRAGESSRHLGITVQPPSTRRPIASSPIEGNSDCRSRAFHVEAYFDHSILRQQPDCGDHTAYLKVYDYSCVPVPASILFTIDGCEDILGARQMAEAFNIPYAPADPAAFRCWPHFLSGTWFSVEARAILEALFRISEGYYFGPHHLIMAVLLHFEEKTLILSPATIVKRASLLTNGIRYGSISIPYNFQRQGKSLHSLYQRQHRLTPHLLFLLPQSRPYYPWCRVPCLARFFPDSDHYSDGHIGADGPLPTSVDQQTLILREFQQHLSLFHQLYL
ncbi:hypothetical protein CK203_104022 [Vitis vinifera]|uniref:Uncharacterized protein n=1 Tax=Vitis vinifera TaxID=29760 RepID=A0A438FGG4_VITVI|nr:hypothetical protein CK203_104022 [Vitis vinifera]